MPNIMMPESREVKVSKVVTIVQSLWDNKEFWFHIQVDIYVQIYGFSYLFILCRNLLYEAYIMMFPKQIASEKKTCVMAAYHTYQEKNRNIREVCYNLYAFLNVG